MPLKTILITGCGTNGIGSALARQFHMRGHTVFASGRSASALDLDPELAVLGCRTLVLDVTSAASIEAAVASVGEATGGRLDIVINNGGVISVMPFADTPADEVRRVFDVNVLGAAAVTRAFLPLLLAARGVVVFMGSVNEVLCPPFTAVYNASKAAVESLARSIRRELAPLGIRVVIAKNGAVRTGLFANAPATLPPGSLYEPLRQYIEGKEFLRGFVEVDDFAAQLAGDLLRENPRSVIWRGGLVWIAWVLSWLGWETMLVSIISGSLSTADRLWPAGHRPYQGNGS